MKELTPTEYAELTRKAAAYDENADWVKWIARAVALVLVTLLLIVFAWKLVSPQLNLYRANTEKQAQIAVSKAKADAAVHEKRAEITRSEGVAEANRIIAKSITDEYVTWLYVDQLDEVQGQIIYIPTEAGIPILEANRLTQETTTDG